MFFFLLGRATEKTATYLPFTCTTTEQHLGKNATSNSCHQCVLPLLVPAPARRRFERLTFYVISKMAVEGNFRGVF